ncbi:hypothetical protein [Pseudoclavibacter sp. RFBA6]|uniref:hypothetical protein n=1 Tax=Pseudoclavibacter sp. RFBA6 TaxID=2080573 RepID=UPI000CE8CED0|nr:hypothetical protein [Pseudoclavibacter sp. RFBA6]PPG38143.1 hypothetical protein C5C17_15975 [Pseudoclavibacter sp. RFBA6]
MQTLGTVLLAVGFLALAGAHLITDPTALDANIGAGFLTIVGLITGATGLLVSVIGALLGTRRRRR